MLATHPCLTVQIGTGPHYFASSCDQKIFSRLNHLTQFKFKLEVNLKPNIELNILPQESLARLNLPNSAQ